MKTVFLHLETLEVPRGQDRIRWAPISGDLLDTVYQEGDGIESLPSALKAVTSPGQYALDFVESRNAGAI